MPCATTLPFQPQAAMRVLQTIKDRYGEDTWSQYGFVRSRSTHSKKWYDTDVVGIDVGITMVMAENARTGFVWDTFMKNLEAQRGMERFGFHHIPSFSGFGKTGPSANRHDQRPPDG